MKFKLKTICYEEAKTTLENYYSIVQEEGNSFFHKQILNVYTEISSKLESLHFLHQEMKVRMVCIHMGIMGGWFNICKS